MGGSSGAADPGRWLAGDRSDRSFHGKDSSDVRVRNWIMSLPGLETIISMLASKPKIKRTWGLAITSYVVTNFIPCFSQFTCEVLGYQKYVIPTFLQCPKAFSFSVSSEYLGLKTRKQHLKR